MDVKRFKVGDDKQPLCKFGPGGEYVYNWPGENADLANANKNALGKVLRALAQIIGATINCELLAELQSDAAAEIKDAVKDKLPKEKTESAYKKHTKPNYSPTIRGAKANKTVPAQPMLFGDNGRTCRRVRHKQTNRLRAHRRTSRKKTPCQIKGQGTLFEINGKSQSAA
jgi:hypothetical protein